MKVLKDNDLSILFKPWGYARRYYLHLTSVLGFSLLSPAALVTEQDLWGKLPSLLGEDQILDEGMPKVCAEFLVTGKCHAPAGEKIPAGRVTAGLGPMEKHLHVFGDRYWRRSHAGVRVITDPEPFSEMTLSYKNAFGGPDFKKNPLGKGFVKNETDETGQRPLPNIELPGGEIGAPTDVPEPAGFAPLDRMWPQRFKNVGTYNEEWQNTRWPYFPADMDYAFFNTAPVDQRLDGFFKGDEAFRLQGMHPEHRRIENSLPPVRPRQFVSRKIDPQKSFEPENLLFEEARLKLDTVWFFPDALLGVLIYHGSVEIQDEDYLDIHRLYLTKEPTDESPGSLEYYRDKMYAAMDMSVPVDMAPFEKAASEFESMLKSWRNIPKRIEEMKKQAMGKSPQMSYTPDETAARLKKVISDSSPAIDKLEAMARDMHKEHGHRVKIDLQQFDHFRKQIADTSKGIDAASAKADDLAQLGEAAKKQTAGDLRERFSAEELEKMGVDPDQALEPPAAEPWQAQAFAFVLQARKNLENDPDAMARLFELGFETHTIERAWLGINPETITMEAETLGLDPGDLEENPINIPPGLVLPVFNEAEIFRVAVRTGADWTDPDDAFILPGSNDAPVFMPACMEENAPVLITPEQMAGLLLEQETGDACHVFWLPDPEAEAGEDAENALSAAEDILLIASPASCADQLEAVRKVWENARHRVLPDEQASLFTACRDGLKIRPWILSALPGDFAQAHNVEIALPAAGEAPGNFMPNIPQIDIKGLMDQAMAEILAFYNPGDDPAGPEIEKALDEAAEHLGRPRSELAAVMEKAKKTETGSASAMGRDAVEKIKTEREILVRQHRLTPELEARFQKAISDMEKVAADLGQVESQAQDIQKAADAKMAELDSGKLPEEAAEKLRANGLDPDRMRSLTRDEVISLHGRGESLSLYNLSGLDLSGLDLRGADLSRAQCIETCFAGAALSEADLSGAMADRADFSGADLTGAAANMTILTKAAMKGAVMRSARLKQAAFSDADLTDTDFSGARLELVSFQTCTADRALFVDASLELVVFNGVTGTAMDFTRMHGYKCLFQDCVLDSAVYSRVRLPACMFMNSRGRGVSFLEADLSRASICQESAFPGSDLRFAKMRESCIKDSDLSEADLRKAHMEGTLVEGCQLVGACMRKTAAPRSKFNRVNLEGADMRGINLMTGSLRRSRLVNADLSSSNLYGTDLYKAEMGRTNLEGSNLKLTLLADGREQFLET